MKKPKLSKNKVTLEDIAVLVKQNSQQIVGLTSVVKQNSQDIEDLAAITAKGFSTVDQKFEEVDENFKKMNQKLDGMSNRIDDAVPGKVSMQQHEALVMRVGKIEQKMTPK